MMWKKHYPQITQMGADYFSRLNLRESAKSADSRVLAGGGK